jgi:hypothetical protein
LEIALFKFSKTTLPHLSQPSQKFTRLDPQVVNDHKQNKANIGTSAHFQLK